MQGEPNHWYERFEFFRKQGRARTLQGTYTAYGRKGKITHVWWGIIEEWQWWKRAEAWDDYEDFCEQWMKRQSDLALFEKIKKDRLEVRDALVDRVREMIQYPLVERVIEDDGKTIIFKPVKWTAADIPAYVKMVEVMNAALTSAPTQEYEAVQTLVKAGVLPEQALIDLQTALEGVNDSIRRWIGGGDRVIESMATEVQTQDVSAEEV